MLQRIWRKGNAPTLLKVKIGASTVENSKIWKQIFKNFFMIVTQVLLQSPNKRYWVSSLMMSTGGSASGVLEWAGLGSESSGLILRSLWSVQCLRSYKQGLDLEITRGNLVFESVVVSMTCNSMIRNEILVQSCQPGARDPCYELYISIGRDWFYSGEDCDH